MVQAGSVSLSGSDWFHVSRWCLWFYIVSTLFQLDWHWSLRARRTPFFLQDWGSIFCTPRGSVVRVVGECLIPHLFCIFIYVFCINKVLHFLWSCFHSLSLSFSFWFRRYFLQMDETYPDTFLCQFSFFLDERNCFIYQIFEKKQLSLPVINSKSDRDFSSERPSVPFLKDRNRRRRGPPESAGACPRLACPPAARDGSHANSHASLPQQRASRVPVSWNLYSFWS